MTITYPLLKDDVLELVPSNDIEYIVSLAQNYKYNMVSIDQARKALKKVELMWNLVYEDKKLGIIFMWELDNKYTVDGYRDDDAVRKITNKISFPEHALNLVTEYAFSELTDVLYTSHSIKNRAATILCKRCGYSVLSEDATVYGDFITLFRRRE